MLVAIWKLIMRDRLVLYPAIIGSFGSALLMQQLLLHLKEPVLLIFYSGAVWFLSLLVQLLVAQIGIETVHGKTANFGQVLWLTVKRFLPVLSIVTCLLIVILGLSGLATIHLFVRVAVLLPILFIAIILQLYPVVYCISGKSAVTAFLVLWTFIRERFQWFVQLMLFLVLLVMTYLLFLTLLVDLPVALKSIILPVIQGCYLVVINYAIIIVWLVQAKVQGVA